MAQDGVDSEHCDYWGGSGPWGWSGPRRLNGGADLSLALERWTVFDKAKIEEAGVYYFCCKKKKKN